MSAGRTLPLFLFFSLILFVSALISLTSAVDRTKFKTCDQSSFCKRNREYAKLEEGASPYALIPESVVTTQDLYTAEITNLDLDQYFLLKILPYQGNVFRFLVSEKTPLRKRFDASEVLVDTISRGTFSSFSTESLSMGESHLVITPSPFRIDLYKNDEIVMTINNRGLFNIEHYRPKEPAQIEDSNGETQPRKYKRVPEIDLWEEFFSTHRDSKPHGPSSVAMDFTFFNTQHIYGIPEHASPLALRTTTGEPGGYDEPYRLYNLDVFEYEIDVPMALYGAVPYLMSHSKDLTLGLFWLNPSETWIDISRQDHKQSSVHQDGDKVHTHWISEAGLMDFFVLTGPSQYDIFAQYASLTGTISLPQMFALGYHQCRWNYKDEEDVAQVDANYDLNDIPYDVIWLDIEHTEGKRYFSWDSKFFPSPDKMIQNIADKGRQMVTIIDPHIKRVGDYHIHQDAEKLGHYIKNSENNDYEGWCWPGSSSWIDYLKPSSSAWWSSLFDFDKYIHSSPNLHTWNDMNEPSVFNGPEVTMHKDALHLDGSVEHREVHNAYGFYMQKATFEGLIQRSEGRNQRPFLLVRSFFAGSQRYGAVWTGDNTAEWSHLKASVPMVLSLSISGIAFSGADVGGFFGNPDPELATRWYQVGAFMPFFRAHAHIDTKRREPWLFGEDYMGHIRTAVRTRYSLLPYLYTQFYNSSITGMPIARPLWVEFGRDVSTFAMDDQFLLGDALLVKPVSEPGATAVDVYFPGDQFWFDLNDYSFYGKGDLEGGVTQSVSAPLEKIPAFIRAGRVIPKKERIRRSSSQMTVDPYTLIVTLDSSAQSKGAVYIDDGKTFNHKKGDYHFIDYFFDDNKLNSTVIHASQQSIANTIERIVIVGIPESTKISKVVLNGKTELEFEVESLQQHRSSFLSSLVSSGVKLSKIVIKKPQVEIGQDWFIALQ